jgi:Pyruvate/2-oxoacid:ferredoxin oxidoreductase gamma subunit
MNMAMLGAASALVEVIKSETFERAIRERFASKGDRIVDLNLEVFRAAREIGSGKRLAARA